MQKEVFQLKRSRSLMAIMFFAVIAMAVAGASYAQSGRRPPKRTKPAETVPPAKTETETAPSTGQPEKSAISLFVTRYSSSIGDSGYYSPIVSKGCAERLKKSSSFDVKEGREMNRKEASDYAQKSTDIYVVWLDIDVDTRYLNRRSSSQTLNDAFRVRYALFEPGTGKAKTQGLIFQRPYQPRIGGVGVPLPLPSSRSVIELSLQQAGEDAADRIISALNASKPNDVY